MKRAAGNVIPAVIPSVEQLMHLQINKDAIDCVLIYFLRRGGNGEIWCLSPKIFAFYCLH
jgi:hypothetical protein